MPNVTFNRRLPYTRAVLHHVLHVVRPYVRDEGYKFDELAQKLEELFYTAGTYIVTDADRAAAGLEMRDGNGLTLAELRVMEERMLEVLANVPAQVFKVEDLPK